MKTFKITGQDPAPKQPRKPSKPYAPNKPKKPEEMVNKQMRVRIWEDQCFLDHMQDPKYITQDLESVFIEHDGGYDDRGDTYLVFEYSTKVQRDDWAYRDAEYERQMHNYHHRYNKYLAEMKIYDAHVEEWKEKNDAYLIQLQQYERSVKLAALKSLREEFPNE